MNIKMVLLLILMIGSKQNASATLNRAQTQAALSIACGLASIGTYKLGNKLNSFAHDKAQEMVTNPLYRNYLSSIKAYENPDKYQLPQAKFYLFEVWPIDRQGNKMPSPVLKQYVIDEAKIALITIGYYSLATFSAWGITLSGIFSIVAVKSYRSGER